MNYYTGDFSATFFRADFDTEIIEMKFRIPAIRGGGCQQRWLVLVASVAEGLNISSTFLVSAFKYKLYGTIIIPTSNGVGRCRYQTILRYWYLPYIHTIEHFGVWSKQDICLFQLPLFNCVIYLPFAFEPFKKIECTEKRERPLFSGGERSPKKRGRF